jgi:diguanylate cyclase (GGDEF)-like protein
VLPSVNLRIIVISVLASLMSGLSTREFLRKLPDYWQVPRLMLVFVFGIYCVYNFSRIFWTLGEDTILSFMNASNFHSFAFILIIYLIIGTSFGFIWMVSKKLENELIELAHHDQLTTILNRRGVDTLARHEFSKLSRESGELSIIMADIDHFKMVNDRFGHLVGDRVLTGFAKLVSEHLRPYDIFGRIGGEEFVIILPNTGLEKALSLAERLRSEVETFVFKENKKEIQITVSFGVAEYSAETDDLEKLIPYADKALYWAKKMGRNTVAQYSPLNETSETDELGAGG